jgi:hypothetical protein
MVDRKPHMGGALQGICSDDTNQWQQLGRVSLNPIPEVDLSSLQAGGTPAPTEDGVSVAVDFGSCFPIGGLEVAASSVPSVDPSSETVGRQMAPSSTRSLHQWASACATKLDANRVEGPNNLNITLPTRCSM